MKYSNSQPPEGINYSQQSPLGEFAWMLGAVLSGLAIVLLVLHFLAAWALPFIPFAQEKKLFNYIAQGLPGALQETSCANKQALLQQLANNLAGHMDLKDEMAIKLHYVNDDTPNAMATLAGNIYIMQGLLDELETENGLAMVVAHEIAHVKHRDPLISFGRGLVSSMVLSLVGAGGAQDLSLLAAAAWQLKFSRDQEAAADSEALAAVNRHYGHAQGAEEFFQLEQVQAVDSAWGDFMSSHPLSQARLEGILRFQSSNVQNNQSKTPLPAALKASCADSALVK
ncbi:MAG: M48 family metallopeptidase [Cellvibrionaceae bacterium]|nr:M48 family metallopeptidase [Cellvibrionaceae bacterium]